MNVKEVMSSPVEVIDCHATVSQAAQKMKASNVGLLPITENGHVIGTLTDRDIVTRVIAERLAPQATPVRQIMSDTLFCCHEEDDISSAAEMMEDKQLRRLLVMDSNDNLIGILSVADIARKSGDEHMTYEVMERICEPAHVQA